MELKVMTQPRTIIIVLVVLLGFYVKEGTTAAVCTYPPNKGGVTVNVSEAEGVGYRVFTYSSTGGDIFYIFGKSDYFELFGKQLRLKKSLDFEQIESHRVGNVGVRDPPTSEALGDFCGPVTINVLPANEYQPDILPKSQTVQIQENLPEDKFVATFNCSDKDKEPDGNPAGCSSIYIESGDDPLPKFKIVNNNTIYTTNNVIDYDNGDVMYTLIVVGVDSSTLDPQKTGSMTVTVHIEPVNEFTPFIDGQQLSINIPETTQIGTEILPVTATDNDTDIHGELTYKITGDPTNIFLMSKNTGKIYLRKFVDYEALASNTYTLTIEVVDGGGLSSTATVDITIDDVNDNAPICLPNEFNKTLREDAAKGGTKILSISCTDGDANPSFTYQILSGDGNKFHVSSNGDLEIAKDLDYDQGITAYYMTIQVSDGIQSTYVWVLIQLSAVNEHRPGFLSNPKITVNENSAIGTMIFKYEADDGDAPPHGVTSYKILNVKNGNQNYFLLDKTSGKIFLGEKLDFEKIQQYEVVVMATDGGRDTTTGTVTINIDNGNDHAPFCKKSSDAISVSESEAIGHVVVADFGCYDVDNNPLTFSLSQNPSDNTFVLDPATKQLKVKGTLDYERTSFYKITITISDGIFSTSLKLSINILNVNEVAPQFIKQDFQSTVSEAATIGTSVATVSATDSDNDTVTYSFLELYPHFVLNPKSGKIILRAPADRETSPTFILYVLASDGEKSSTATVSVTVEDINEHPVFKQSSYQLLVSENTATGTTVGSISAVDDDEGINGQVHYRIVSGNDDSKFHIDISKGIISVVTPIDYEDIKTVVMAIEAFDLGSPSLSTECSVIVKILDKNDNAPELLQTVLQERVSESALIGQSVISVFAEDADSSLNDNNKITYFSASLVPFQVNPVNGTVTVTGDLDRETKDKYEMVITATDGGNPRMTGTLSLKIIVSDVNDHDPVITGSYVTTVSENAPEHSVIFNISAYDADTEKFGKLNYEIILGNLNSIFKIESNTGVVQLATTLDREYKDRYELIVKVTDNGVPPRSSTVTAVVNVGDENDSPPVLSKSVYEFSIQEHVRQNTLVGNIEATDKDIGKNAKLKYSIATIWKGNTGVFDIKEMTGEILTNGVVDREAYDEYSLLMRAKDSGTPTLFSDVIVKIKIDDINDNPPIFRRQEFSTAIFENLAVNSKIHTTGATDRDVGINAIIKYELDISNKNGLLADYYFGVYGNTGDIFLKRRIDREAYDELTFTVIVRDTGVPSLSSSANVTVQIQDVNDNRPVFSPVFYNSEVSSVKLCDAEVTKITATDADLGKNAAINFELETKDLPFVVSPLGKVKANGKLVDSKYVFKIMAHDNGNPFLTSSDPALVRVDRFDPNKVVITFHLGMTLASFYQMETNFLQQLEEALLVKYVTPYVKRWCVLENKESVLVYIYAVKTELTNDIKNLHRNKAFLTNGEFLDLLEIDVNGRPFIEDERWDEYKIEKVVPYGGKRVNADPVVSPVEESDTSLAVPLALSLLLIIGIIIAVLILCLAWRKRWCRKKKKKEDLKTRAHIIEKMGQENDGTVFEKEMERVPSTINPTFSTAFLSANTVDEPLKPTKNTENTSAGKGHEGEDNRNSEPSPFNSSKFAKRSLVSPAYSGNEIVNPVPTNGEKLTNYVLATSPKTTKRGKDIVTGWIYEEDPQTKVRNWIRTPTGENQSSYFY